MYVCLHVCVYVCIVCMFVCMYSVCVCMFVCLHVLSTISSEASPAAVSLCIDRRNTRITHMTAVDIKTEQMHPRLCIKDMATGRCWGVLPRQQRGYGCPPWCASSGHHHPSSRSSRGHISDSSKVGVAPVTDVLTERNIIIYAMKKKKSTSGK